MPLGSLSQSVRCGNAHSPIGPEPCPPRAGPTFSENPKRPPSVSAERSRPHPARESSAGRDWGRRQSVLGLRRLWPWPWLGAQFSAALHAGRHGSRLAGCPSLIGILGLSEAPAADWGFQREAGPRGSGAFPGWQGALDRGRGDAPGARAGPAAPTSGAGSVGTVRLAAPPFSRAAATPSRTSCKGISTFFLCSSCPEGPCLPLNSESGATRSGGARGTGGPGSQPSIPAPSPSPFVRGGCGAGSQPAGPGAGPRSLFPVAAPGPVGQGRGPAISQAGPRGMCRFILPWRTGGPEIRPFFALCILF